MTCRHFPPFLKEHQKQYAFTSHSVHLQSCPRALLVHFLSTRDLNYMNIPQITKLVYSLGDIMLIRPGKQEGTDMLDVDELCEVSGSCHSSKGFSVQGSGTQKDIPRNK